LRAHDDTDRAAELRFRELYDSYGAHIYAYFRRRTDDPPGCAAETFLVAWRRLSDVPQGDAALRWLCGVARRILLNQPRSSRRFRSLVTKLGGIATADGVNPETIVVQLAEHADLLNALNRLPERDQELLRLASWEELPHAAIAEIMNCSVHAVDQRIYRARGRLAREMRRTGHGHVVGTTPAIESGDRER
jgi:RNA polymerase sigma-70 factor (ECF subfamily)